MYLLNLLSYNNKLFIVFLLKSVFLVLILLGVVAYYILVERNILGSNQRRKGPNVVGIYGLLQSVADGLKLIVKEQVIPSSANSIIFSLSPIITFFVGLGCWAVIPFGEGSVISNINLGILYIFAVSSLGVYAIIMSGWSSNSKYAFLGAVRSAAQMVSYEVAFGFSLIPIFIITKSLNLSKIVHFQDLYGWFIIPLFPLAIIFFIIALAETNRHPFDLPEAESELVSGYNVEYSSMPFALFFLGEYLSILGISSLFVVLFFGGWSSPFGANGFFLLGPFWFAIKMVLVGHLFVIVRAVLPRYRYDQLIGLGWQIFVPLTIVLVLFYAMSFFILHLDNFFLKPHDGPLFEIWFKNYLKIQELKEAREALKASSL